MTMRRRARRVRCLVGVAILALLQNPAMADIVPDAGTEAAVTQCPGFGPGFIRMPGTQSCLKTGGQITISHETNSASSDLFAETSYVAGEPFLIYDLVARDRAVLQSKVDAMVTFTAATPTDHGPLVTFAALRGIIDENPDQSLFVDQAFVALAGFTVGRRASFFDFSTGLSFKDGYASSAITNLIAYTRPVGLRGALTVSLEDNRARRVEDGVWSLRSGDTLPDLVVSGRIERDWGAAQISAALIHLADDRATACCGKPDDRLGFAVSAGAEYRTRVAGRFARFIVGGAYAEGGMSYLGGLPFASDYLVDGNGAIVPTKGFSLLASYEHVWREDLKSTVTVSGISARMTTQALDWRPTTVLATLGTEYMPAPGLMVGLEGSYYVDSGKARYFGVEGERSQTDFFKLTSYARRQF
ncbi:MAG: porin [Phyllobacteriaceae bacterium]|jgi:hypothetical protein|nr:porin [Phyllobacteriaceae bacterium]